MINQSEAKERIAVNLQRAMDAVGMSQNRLAVESGEDPMTVSRVLRGITEPRVSTLARLAEVVGITMDQCLQPVSPASRKKSRFVS